METVTAIAESAAPEFDRELLNGTKKLNAATVHYEAVNGQFVEEAASQPRLTDSAWKIPEHVDLEQVVSVCEDMDGEALGEIFEKNWSPTMKETNLLVRIAKEMKRKFQLIKGKRDVHGKPLTIRGCTSFKGWFPKATGKSFQYGYYLLKDKGSSSSRTPSRPPCSSDQAAETLARTFYVIRRKSDGKFYTHGDGYADQVELAASEHAAKEWSATLTDLDNICHGDLEVVEVEATYNLTTVAPTEPQPTAEAPKPTKKRKTTKQAAELPKPKTKQSKDKKKLEAVIDELRRIDSVLDSAPVDEFGWYVNEPDQKMARRRWKLEPRLRDLEKLVQP